MNFRTLAAAALLFVAAPLWADDKDEALAKQRESAAAKWKKMAFEKSPPVVETANFLVHARLPETKTKALASALDRQFPVMLKALKYEGEDRPWPGKLQVFVFAERSEFTDFMRKALKKPVKEDDSTFFSFEAEDSVLVIGAPRGGAKTDPEAEAKHQLATAVLARKMGSGEPPDWVALGFGEAAAYRAANPKATGKNPAWKPPGLPLAALWTEGVPAAARAKYAAYVIDYMAFGPLAEHFPTFIASLRPDETGTVAGIDEALKAINLDQLSLEYAARNWIKPKPPAKPKK
ncbi:MAG: hypothetical protein ACJ8F7_07620 [Gemmataceae bacterium]